jgi:tetratricopeptide (TPR) repeat protein
LIDLLNRAFNIEENDPQEQGREKVESGIRNLVGSVENLIPYVGSLYSLSYPKIEEISPEFWKARLLESIQTILSALTEREQTILIFEDLHWADPSFIELLHNTLLNLRQPAIVLCVYRPQFTLFSTHQLSEVPTVYEDIRLQDLSPSDAQAMVQSLLHTSAIPSQLQQFIKRKVEGNPFYLEEMINSLIESGALSRENGTWKLSGKITESDISSTIHGVISARVDRLEKQSKRILQEASVIGRSFLYDILESISTYKGQCQDYVKSLEQFDLIRIRSLQPEIEYVFKHALTQEVVYNGILKKERKEIHERIGNVMETLFENRLTEFYETLSLHFKEGLSTDKAVHYLRKSGQKNFKRFAVEESHKYYQEAFDLLSSKPEKNDSDFELLVDLIFDWAIVYYFRGDFKGMSTLLRSHLATAEALHDKTRLGMYYAWYGFSIIMELKKEESYGYLMKALRIGEEIHDESLIGYACAWLPFTCVTWGRLDEAMSHGRRALEIAKKLKKDLYLYYKPIAGIAFASQFTGHTKDCFELGQLAIKLGRDQSNPRSMAIGYVSLGTAEMVAGDHSAAISAFKKAMEVAGDPFYRHWARMFLAQSLVLDGKTGEAEKHLPELHSLSIELGWEESLGWLSEVLMAIIDIVKGNLQQGVGVLERGIQEAVAMDVKPWRAMIEHVLGKVYLEMATGKGLRNFPLILRNLVFSVKNLSSAGRKSEYHLQKALEIAEEIGSEVILSQAYFDLALLHRARKRFDKSRSCLEEAMAIFERCGAKIYLERAKQTLVSLR